MTVFHTFVDGRPVIGILNITGPTRSTQNERRFVSSLLALLGDVRALYLFNSSGTTLTDRSKNQRVLTWSEGLGSFDTPPSRLGSGFQVTFNGVDEEGDAPDSDDLSFGDGKVDQPFTAFGLVNPSDATSSVILSKFDTAVGQEEWLLELDASDRPRFALFDDGAAARIARLDATALGQGSDSLIVGTSDGSGASTGLKVYKNAVRVDDADDNSGTYIAMENGGEVVSLGYRQSGGVKENFFDGSMALAGIVGKELTVNEIWVLKELCKSYFGLSL